MRTALILTAAAAAFCAAPLAAQSKKDIGYDPRANAFDQLAGAVAAAKADDKLVLLISGGDNKNTQFFARLPEAAGAPHFWVLASSGEPLESQDTVPLEDGAKSYDRAKFHAFVEQWRARAAAH